MDTNPAALGQGEEGKGKAAVRNKVSLSITGGPTDRPTDQLLTKEKELGSDHAFYIHYWFRLPP